MGITRAAQVESATLGKRFGGVTRYRRAHRRTGSVPAKDLLFAMARGLAA
jgi:hypothetical protein